tara:strand:- start:3807 stop:3914 length:108 start_codon:yes stop_codon:yes gene_type:complete
LLSEEAQSKADFIGFIPLKREILFKAQAAVARISD